MIPPRRALKFEPLGSRSTQGWAWRLISAEVGRTALSATSEVPDSWVMATICPPRSAPARPGVPRGPRGLWNALASVSTASVSARTLPVFDLDLVGRRGVDPMFDYDASLAISLGDELDPATLLG